MKNLFLALALLGASFSVFASVKCSDKIEKVGERSALFKSVLNIASSGGIFKTKSEQATGVFDVYVNQKCFNNESKAKGTRVLFKVQTRRPNNNRNYYSYCYSRVKRLPGTEWTPIQTVCERVKDYVPTEEYSDNSFPYGGSEDPFYFDGQFRSNVEEIQDYDFPPISDYAPGRTTSPSTDNSSSEYSVNESGEYILTPDGPEPAPIGVD